MPPRHVRIVRPPYDYKSHDFVVHEDTLATYLVGYLLECGFVDVDVADFFLQPSTTLDEVVHDEVSDYVVLVRDAGEGVHYALRVAKALRARSTAKVWLYGHTARLPFIGVPDGVQTCIASESQMATLLGIEAKARTFEQGLTAGPYVPYLKLPDHYRERFRAHVETTRGCHFPCDFCFINSGDNYDRRFMMRPNEAILTDMRLYYSLGARQFRFADSEFLGANRKLYPQRRELLRAIADEFGGKINIQKIWVRADTLNWFDDFALLRAAGIRGAFLGVESLHQPDLDAMNKRLSVADIEQAIRGLAKVGIEMNLSFITFNRNTTVSSLRANIDGLRRIYDDVGPEFLGCPNFVFRQEYATKPRTGGKSLSGRTYVSRDLGQEVQTLGLRTAYDADLEPYIELMRLLSYEYNQKKYDLSDLRHHTLEDLLPWDHALGPFCVTQMGRFLDRFEAGELTLDTLVTAREDLFAAIGEIYELLPEGHRGFATYEQHAARLNYQVPAPLLEPEQYWTETIPF